MTVPRSTDRDAILARRALFISTALAGIACTGAKPSADTQASTTEAPQTSAVAEAEAEAEAESAQPKAPEGPPRNTPWDEVIAEAPPRDIPAGVSERERERLRLLEHMHESTYATLRAIWDTPPECGAEVEGCEAWAEIAETLARYDENGGRFASVTNCGSDGVGETGSVLARRQAHHRFQMGIARQLEAWLGEVAKHYGEASAKAWPATLQGPRAPQPMPCLSACASPTFPDVVADVAFETNSAALALDKPQLQVQFNLDSVRQGSSWTHAGAKLVVRGHADPSETDPEGLAKQRAEAVVAWLVEAGIPASQLEAVSMGSTYAVERGEAGLEHNPRVDFELIPPGLVAKP